MSPSRPPSRSARRRGTPCTTPHATPRTTSAVLPGLVVPLLLAASGTSAAQLAPAPAPPGLSPGAGQHAARPQHQPADPPHVLDYVSSSIGLDVPAFEGGRTELEFGDVNGDGHPDLVSIGDHGSPFIGTQEHGLMVWFGDGRGSWVVQQTGDFGYGGVALGDVNGDGLMDAGYGMHHDYSATDLGDQLLEVALGDGTGTAWLPWDDGLATSGETWGMFGTDFGDMDGDGDLDVVSNSFGCCAGVHVYRNHGDGTWSQSWGFLGGNSAMDALFADVDGDGHLDVLAANQDGRVFRGNGTGNFLAAQGNLPGSYFGLAGGDVDGDGRDEYGIVSGGAPTVWSWSPGNVWVPRNDGLPASGSYQAMQLADMDGDGHRDVLAFGKGTLTVWLGDGTGAWAQAYTGTTPGASGKDWEALRAGADFDHNGYADLALLQEETFGLFNDRNVLYAFREASTPTEPFVRVVEPSAGRVWRAGQVRFVDWTAAVPGLSPGGDAGSVRVDLSDAGPDGPWSTLAGAVPNNGRWQLVVPAGFDGTDCWVRLVLDSPAGSAVGKRGPFTILP